MADDILDTIDNALDDWSMSADAMRWTPENPAPPTLPPPGEWQTIGWCVDDTPLRQSVGRTWQDAPLLHGHSMQTVSLSFDECAEHFRRMTARRVFAESIFRLLGLPRSLMGSLDQIPVRRQDYRARQVARRRRRRG